jgi:hypothetical protein
VHAGGFAVVDRVEIIPIHDRADVEGAKNAGRREKREAEVDEASRTDRILSI